jgi:hypothetical protein
VIRFHIQAGALQQRLAALALLMVAGASPAADPASQWAVAGGRIQLELNQGVLDPLGITAEIIGSVEPPTQSHPLGYRGATFEGLTLQRIDFSAPHGAIREFTGGYLQYHGGLTLTVGDRTLDATDFRMAPHPDFPTRFRLLDRAGTPWAVLDHGHFELVDDARGHEHGALEIRHANLSMTSELAALVGDPGLEGQPFGRASLRAPVVRAGAITAVRGSQCSDPNWPTDPGFEADISLIDMAQYRTDPTVGAVACPGCDGASGGIVAVTPNATLENTGTADVPWWEQFTAPQEPYGNDQHPYLVWNLYRLDDGRFEQIGVSGLKHAFFTINDNCPCPGGNVVWVGCQDVYSIASNNINRYLAPRGEIIPATGQWGRCGSLFDADCDGQQSRNERSDGPLDNRMLVVESDLADPGARYFIEAWYVVRDDIDRFNTMGWREIDPTWNGSIWTFPTVGEFTQGPALDAWADDAGARWDRVVVETEDGALSVVVRAFDTGGGWRYDYVVMNHDWMRAVTAGAEPDLQIISNLGFTAVELPRDPAGAVGSLSSARADRSRGGDWPGVVEAEFVRWSDPGDTPLDWGRGFRFSLTADQAPGPSTLRLSPGDGSPDLGAPILGPALPEALFGNGFETLPIADAAR